MREAHGQARRHRVGDVGIRGNADRVTVREYGRAIRKAAHPGNVRRLAGYIAFTISSTIFFASANSIMVLSRKKSSFSMPA